MAAQPEYLNKMEKEAVYRIREIFADGREASVAMTGTEERAFVSELAETALYPEKPLFFFQEEKEDTEEIAWYPRQKDTEFFSIVKRLKEKPCVRRLLTCGGVDDGKSTLIGKILYETKDKAEQEAIAENPLYLRKDGSVDYALLAGTTEEEAKQGITVQVSYSVFDWKKCSFLMADVPGHEEYTRNMAYAAESADTAIIMIGANKGIVPQTRRHTKICYFMGIRNLLFAVNKMDMVAFSESVFSQISEEIAQLMEEYPDCKYKIVPVAAKSGVNITENAKEMPWYTLGSLLDVLEQTKESKKTDNKKGLENDFCMPVQRICKSSQMQGAVIKKRVIQGEAVSGALKVGDEIFVYPTARRAKVAGLYALNQSTEKVAAGDAIGIELDRELDVARGYILTKEDVLTATDRMEVDILWTSDSRLTQGRRYQVRIGTSLVAAVVTKICYQVDVNTGEHRYAEYLTKNELARCELCFRKTVTATCEKDSRALGTIKLIDREDGSLAAYGNIVQTISEDAWKEDGREVSAKEREEALGQKAGIICFGKEKETATHRNYVERYLLRMGFHTIQTTADAIDEREEEYIKSFLDAGLIVLLQADAEELSKMKNLLEENRIFDCSRAAGKAKDMGSVLKQIKQWASELI